MLSTGTRGIEQMPISWTKTEQAWSVLPPPHHTHSAVWEVDRGVWRPSGSLHSASALPLGCKEQLMSQHCSQVSLTVLCRAGSWKYWLLKCNHCYQGIACNRLITASWLWDPRRQCRNWVVNLEKRKGTWMMGWWLHLITKPMPFT